MAATIYQVKWVSRTGRYTTTSFATLARAEACKKRHEDLGRPARVVTASKPKTVTELRAILDERAPYAAAIKDAMTRGDIEACAAAQKAMRERFA